MLSDELKKAIREVAAHAPTRAAASTDALKLVQKARGYVSDEDLRETAALLGMSADALEGVATFYSLIFRRPVGRHVIFVCDSISCWVARSPRIIEALSGRLGIALGETTADGCFTLLPVACLGACSIAPVIKLDGEFYGHLTTQKLDALIDQIGGKHE